MKDPILVLNGYDGWKPAMLLSSAGEQKELACFERDDTTEAFQSCSINWNNQLFIFGGRSDKRQISQLTGHKLEKVGSLDFDLFNGACSVMNNRLIYLCFNTAESTDYRRCRRATGPLEQFSQVPLSIHDHTSIGTSCSDCKL